MVPLKVSSCDREYLLLGFKLKIFANVARIGFKHVHYQSHGEDVCHQIIDMPFGHIPNKPDDKLVINKRGIAFL